MVVARSGDKLTALFNLSRDFFSDGFIAFSFAVAKLVLNKIKSAVIYTGVTCPYLYEISLAWVAGQQNMFIRKKWQTIYWFIATSHTLTCDYVYTYRCGSCDLYSLVFL